MRLAATTLLVSSLMVMGCAEEMKRKPLSVHVLYPEGGLDHNGCTDMVHNAIIFGRWQFALEDHEIEICKGRDEDTDCEAVGAAERALDQILGEHPDKPQLLVTMGDLYTPLLNEKRCALNGTKVLHLDGRVDSCRSLRSVLYRTYGPAFLAGVAAIEQLKADNEAGRSLEPRPLRAGIIGVDTESSGEYIEGFAAGVRYAGGEVLDGDMAFIPEDYDESQAGYVRELTQELLQNGIRAILAAAGNIGPEVSAEVWKLYISEENRFVNELGKTAYSPAYVITVDSDQNMINSQVMLGSVVKHVDSTVRDAMYEVASGEFSFGSTTVGFDDGATEFIYNPTIYEETVNSSIESAHQAALEAAARYDVSFISGINRRTSPQAEMPSRSSRLISRAADSSDPTHLSHSGSAVSKRRTW